MNKFIECQLEQVSVLLIEAFESMTLIFQSVNLLESGKVDCS